MITTVTKYHFAMSPKLTCATSILKVDLRIYFTLCMWSFACMYVCALTAYIPGALRGQKRLLEAPALTLQMVVNHWMCMVETKPGSFARAANVLNHWVVCSTPCATNLKCSHICLPYSHWSVHHFNFVISVMFCKWNHTLFKIFWFFYVTHNASVIHLTCIDSLILWFYMVGRVFCCMNVPLFAYPCSQQGIFQLFPVWGYYSSSY